MTPLPTHMPRGKSHKAQPQYQGRLLAGWASPYGSRCRQDRHSIGRKTPCRLGLTVEPGHIQEPYSFHSVQIRGHEPGQAKLGYPHWSAEGQFRILRRNYSGQNRLAIVVRPPLISELTREQKRSGILLTELSFAPPKEKPKVALVSNKRNLKGYFGSKSMTNLSASSNASLNACIASTPIMPFSIEKPSSALKLRWAEYAPLNGSGFAIENLAGTFVADPSSCFRTPENVSDDSRNSIAMLSTLICNLARGNGSNGFRRIRKLGGSE